MQWTYFAYCNRIFKLFPKKTYFQLLRLHIEFDLIIMINGARPKLMQSASEVHVALHDRFAFIYT
jgi:hypothetical protein